MRVMFVAFNLNVLIGEAINIGDVWIQLQPWKGKWFSRDLQLGLFKMIVVQVGITQRVNKDPRFEVADLCHHVREKCVRGNVERDAKKNIGASLVELAIQFSIGDMKLEKGMAWH